MERKRKGLKRHETLKPLSRHHMIALHLALKLSRAGTDKSRLTVKEIKQELQEICNTNDQQQFREEDQIVFTFFAQHASSQEEEKKEMLFQHVELRAHIDTILKMDEI